MGENRFMNNTLNFRGKIALITGAVSGMGLAAPNAFAEV
jgi:NAD(P)-dependent dehydrogenase (short-subunit alcohol dehydrogenase family)